jgi:Glu-tRNA(Gln) amidotransferase subunit E-like FAD-binding protein
MKSATILKVIETSAKGDPSKEEMDRLVGRAAMDYLPEGVVDKALAEAAPGLLPPERIEAASLEAASGLADLSEEEIDEILSKAADEAVRDIAQGGYHGIIGSEAKEIIDLGLAVYGHGDQVKAVFGPVSGSTPGPDPDEPEKS